MAKNVQLTIPQACHEDWHRMTPNEQGRYCMSCCKTVVDFTNMSDRAILHHIANAGGSRICGRLAPDQLHRSITIQKESRWPWLKYFFQFTLPAFLISMKASGQETRKNSDTVVLVSDSVIVSGKCFSPPSPKITGQVMDYEGNPLQGVTVLRKNSNIGTSTDKDGYFSIPCNKDEEVVLVISSVGFMPQEIKLKANSPGLGAMIKLSMQLFLAGDVVIVRHISKKPRRSAIEVARSVIMPDSVKLSPNPVGVGNDISVELNVKQPGNFNIEVCDLSGRMISKKTVLAESKCFKTSIGTQAMTPGTYVVSIRNHKGKKIGVKKIIVQN